MIDRHLIVSKADKVDNCLKRIHEKRSVTLNEFLSDLDRQESILFNLQMAIQNCIDIAAHKKDVFLEMIEDRNTFESA
jgi:uncharacterized protein YutE (UPF0331/DUF86 family)